MSGWESVLSVANTAIQFMLVITILVAVHELGHYLVARWMGMEVEAFAVMMGGVRKTDLTPYLDRPTIPSRFLWYGAGAGLIVMIVGTIANSSLITDVGLAIAGVIVPLLAAVNLTRLYHLPESTPYLRFGGAFLAGIVMLLFATGFKTPQPEIVIGLAVAAALFAMLITYYAPVSNSDEDEQGHGQIMARGEYIPVRFRPLWHRVDKNGTEFSMLLLPLGGFARIKGMHPKDDGSETQVPNGFYSKHPWARLAALFAGPLFSVGFGVLVLTALWSTEGRYGPVEAARVGMVAPDMPAAEAGLKEGDLILSVNGQSIEKFEQIKDALRGNEGTPVEVIVDRAGTQQTMTLTPQLSEEELMVLDADGDPIPGERERRAQIGVAPGFEYDRMTVGAAFSEAMRQPYVLVKGLARLVVKPESAKDTVGGPVTIARVTHVASQSGFGGIALLAAMLSLTLGVMNLLPVPPLDGGQIVINFLELFTKGKRLSIGFQRAVTSVGFVLIMLLMLSAATLDLGRISEDNEAPKASQSASSITPEKTDSEE
ncbi:MAG: site-2 protease family protein [Fimbriimonadaceae bacterium]|nr:site-2 protease family protein [Fimbriimonadaceae bacterium]